MVPKKDEPAQSALSRRQRNAQHRALDMEFATEIGQNLLVEVRRLQALLSERDRALSKVQEERDGWEQERDALVNAVRSAESNVGEYITVIVHLLLNMQNDTRKKIGTSKSRSKTSAPATTNSATSSLKPPPIMRD